MVNTAAPTAKQRRQRAPHSSESLDVAEAEIERRMVLAETADMAGYLQEHLGQKLTAYLAGLKDAKSVGQWTQARSEPSAITRERLRAAFHATSLFLTAYGDREAQGWFFGANSSLDDRAPAAVLREAETPAEMALIAPLARAFVRGAH
jgi:ABC-type Fe2+-enterobactin transport system substrate-binding protein